MKLAFCCFGKNTSSLRNSCKFINSLFFFIKAFFLLCCLLFPHLSTSWTSFLELLAAKLALKYTKIFWNQFPTFPSFFIVFFRFINIFGRRVVAAGLEFLKKSIGGRRGMKCWGKEKSILDRGRRKQEPIMKELCEVYVVYSKEFYCKMSLWFCFSFITWFFEKLLVVSTI